MPSLRYYSGTDWLITQGYKTKSFNIPGDPSGAIVDGDVRYRFFIERDGGGKVDLGDVTVYMRSPDGERQTLFYNFDELGKDGDDGEDSDAKDDYDISFWGTDSVSRDGGFNNNPINGNWKLEVNNSSGETLRLKYLEVWIDSYDYPPAPDMAVTDLVFSGNPTYDEFMTIEAKLQNQGDAYAGPFEAHLYINGGYVEKSLVTLGLWEGQSWTENFTFKVDTTGETRAEVRLVNLDSDDRVSSNNTRTEYFTPKQGDFEITDIRYTGNPSLGELMTIQADVANTGDGNILFENVEIKLFVNDSYVESSFLTAGLYAQQVKQENFTFRVTDGGTNTVRLEIEEIDGESDYSNNIATGSFIPKQHDITISDLSINKTPYAGESIRITATAENIGDDSTLDAFDIVFEDADGNEIGRREVSFGLLEQWSNDETISYDVPSTHTGALEITARIEGIAQDKDYSNNSYTESFDTIVTTLNGKSTEIALAAHIVNAVYGDADIPEPFRGADDNGLDDDYDAYFASLFNRSVDSSGDIVTGDAPVWKVMTGTDLGSHFGGADATTRFTDGGLYEGRVESNHDGGYTGWNAQALLTKGVDADGDTTLVLGLRGTDDVFTAVLDGEAYSGFGQYQYYSMLRPLIDAAVSYANDAGNGIDKLVVAGHSLAGAMVDLFTAVDARQVSDGVELHAIAIASAGLDASVLEEFESHDTSVVEDKPFVYEMKAPDFYLGLSHSEDTVTFPQDNFIGQNLLLYYQQRFIDGLYAIDLPNVDNDDKPGLGNFKAEHSSGLYAATLRGLAIDPLLDYHNGHRLVIGNTDIPDIEDLDGLPLTAFSDYEGAGEDDEISTFYADEYVLGLSGDDTIRSYGGNDLVSGGAGDDNLFTGSGDDLAHGGSGNDDLRGGADEDALFGGRGDDLLAGGTESDLLYGEDGNDTLDGGAGSDYLDGGAGVDWADYSYGYERMVISLEGGFALENGTGDNDTLLNIENVLGSGRNDRIVGDSGDNHLIGGYGDDVINGLGGKDLIDGGYGNDDLSGDGSDDTIYGGAGLDVIVGLGGADVIDGGIGADWINAGLGLDTATGGAGDDILFGSGGADLLQGADGNDALRGGAGADDLRGGAGNDNIVGNNGTDTLIGGAGDDVLTGGNGNAAGDSARDTFVFLQTANGGGGFDRIRDFEDTRDKLDLSDLGYVDFADVAADAYDVAGHMEINLMGAGIVRIDNFQFLDFGAGDVIL